MIEFIDHIDKVILLWFNGLHNAFLDNFMLLVSGKITWLPLYILFLYLIFKKFKDNSYLILIFIAITITLSDQTSVHLFKNIFQRLRPCHQSELIKFLWLPAGCGGQYGFVSSHAANSFSLVAFLSLLFKNRKITLLLIFWGILIGLSRIYLAAHFLSDVIAGSLLGIIIGFITYLLYKRTNTLIKEKIMAVNQKNQ